jgi:hypothetical protein
MTSDEAAAGALTAARRSIDQSLSGIWAN